MITIIYGPPGSGKTTNADLLKGKYGCTRIIDDWVLGDSRPLQDGDLVLCQEYLGWNKDCKLIHIAEALRS